MGDQVDDMVKTLVKLVDGHHLETVLKIEDVKADVAKVDAKVDNLTRSVNTKWEKDNTPC